MTAFDTVTFLLLSHFVADFVFQTRQMGENKSTSFYWLSMHVLTYTVVLALTSSWYLIPLIGFFSFLKFVALNGALHFVTDFITSKLSGYFYIKAEAIKHEIKEIEEARNNVDLMDSSWKNEKELMINRVRMCMKKFWTMIGFDQFIHGATLTQTLKLFI